MNTSDNCGTKGFNNVRDGDEETIPEKKQEGKKWQSGIVAMAGTEKEDKQKQRRKGSLYNSMRFQRMARRDKIFTCLTEQCKSRVKQSRID